MGKRVAVSDASAESREALRARLDRSVDVLGRMVAEGWFASHHDTMGAEVELNLVDPLGRPRLVNDPVLGALARRDFQHELGQFNLELNMRPRTLRGSVLADLERDLTGILATATARSERLGARIVAVGTLPTLSPEHVVHERLSSNPRYRLLAENMLAARGEEFALDIVGEESLAFHADTVAPEAAATSLQLHLRVRPEDFPRYYNASLALGGAQVAVAANSPFLLGRRLWAETRIPLCEQSLDTRTPELAAQGVRPRVWVGERWASSVVEIFAENVRYFPPLLVMVGDEDPDAALAAGRAPSLQELRLHSGTVWRWNRPVYDVQRGRPQLRIENRVLPSGPTVVDMVANAAFFLGAVRGLADADPVWERLRFSAAEDNLRASARRGLSARVAWPGAETTSVRRLVLDVLLPLAAKGLDAWGVIDRDRDRYLGVVEARVRSGRTGAVWQVRTVEHLERRGFDRAHALREMTRRYVENATGLAPVHTWPVVRPR